MRTVWVIYIVSDFFIVTAIVRRHSTKRTSQRPAALPHMVHRSKCASFIEDSFQPGRREKYLMYLNVCQLPSSNYCRVATIFDPTAQSVRRVLKQHKGAQFIGNSTGRKTKPPSTPTIAINHLIRRNTIPKVDEQGCPEGRWYQKWRI